MLLRNIFSLSLVVLLIGMLLGCGEEINPISVDGTTFGEVKKETANTQSEAAEGLRVVRTISATANNGVAAAPSFVNTEDGEQLQFLLEHEVNISEGTVNVTIIVENGAIISYDYIKVYVGGNRYLGRARAPRGSFWSEVEISIEIEDLPTNEEITLTVKVERNGEIAAEEETETFEISTSVEVEVEDVERTSDDEITITLITSKEEESVNIDVVNRSEALAGGTLTLDGEEVDIRRIFDRDGNLIVRTDEDLEAGNYEFAHNGDGLETEDEEPVTSFSYEFEIGEQDDDDDEEPVTTPAVWKTVTLGTSSSSGVVRAAVAAALGIQLSVNADYLVRNAMEVEEEETDVDFYALALPDHIRTIGQAIEWAVGKGYQLTSTEAAYALRKAYTGQPHTEHILVLSPFMLNAAGTQSLLILTGHGITLNPGDGLVAHGFAGLNGVIDSSITHIAVTCPK